MAQFKNWKCNSYRFGSKKEKDYSYLELKEYFYIDGSEVIYCKRDFGDCEAGNYYLVSDGTWYGCGFVVNEYAPFKSWIDREYMKEGKVNEALGR